MLFTCLNSPLPSPSRDGLERPNLEGLELEPTGRPCCLFPPLLLTLWRWFEGFMPSKILTTRMFVGSSEIGIVTGARHSGQHSSWLVWRISSRHLLQNVCWHGNTLHVPSKSSRQTEHSRSSFICFSSISGIGQKGLEICTVTSYCLVQC